MMRLHLPSEALQVSLALGLLTLPGCPSPKPSPDAAAPANPAMLWLSPVGRDETHVQLIDTEPPPF